MRARQEPVPLTPMPLVHRKLRQHRGLTSALTAVALLLGAALASCDEAPSELAVDHVARAKESINNGEHRAGIINLKNAVQQDPDNAEARELLGTTYLAIGDAVSAIKELRKARELGRGGDQLQLDLVQALLLNGAHQQVLDELPRVLPFDSEVRSDINVARAEALFSLERLDDSVAILEAAIATLPTPRAYAAAARLALFQGNLETAEARIDEGLRKYPDVVTLYVVRGELFLIGRQFVPAMGAFEKAIELSPGHFSSRIGLVRTHIGLRQFDQAGAALESLAKEAPADPTVLLLRGVVALESADYVAAAGLADEVLASFPDNLTAVYISGAASYALNQVEKAHSLLSRYVAGVSGDVVARKMLAAVQLRLGQASDAQETLEPVSAGAEGDGEFLSLASTAAVIAGDLVEGRRYLELAATGAPDDPALRARLGLVKIAAGDTDAGTSDLERALELDPGQDRAELALILTYLKERRFEEALVSANRLVAKHGDMPAGFVLAGIACLTSAPMGQTEVIS